MKKTIKFVILIILFISYSDYVESQNIDDSIKSIGMRLKQSDRSLLIYFNNNGNIDTSKYRTLNSDVYFKYLDFKENGDFVLITIPGKIYTQKDSSILNGAYVSKYDYQSSFWINKKNIENSTQPEYLKYKSSLFSGILTIPFKYRLKTKNNDEDYIDGSVNLGYCLGYKISVSNSKPNYIGIIGFAESTSISYNSSNNKFFENTNNKETGFGFSYGAGIVFQFNKSISPGFIIGFDHGIGENGKEFNYQDSPWISFSLNYDFIKPKLVAKDN